MKIQTLKIYLSLMLVCLFLFNIGCDTTESIETSLSLSFASESSLPKIADDGFQIQEVKLQLKEIKIQNQADENEIQIKTGPKVISLNLNGASTEVASSGIPAGNYDRIKFEIHKIQDSELSLDPDFQDENDSLQRFSTIVKGMLNGESFTYRFRKSAKQDIKLDENLVLAEGETANLTITVNPYNWFYEGDIFLNPTDLSNESKIENNMKNAFKQAFKDNNYDGVND